MAHPSIGQLQPELPKPNPLVATSPFLSHLETNDPLNAKDLPLVKTLIRAQQSKLDVLDSNITKFRDQLMALEEQRWPISDFIRRHKRLVGPLRALPDDILQEIFVQCSESNDVLGSMSANDAPMLLTRVCKPWRNVVLNTPRLWSRMHIPLPSLDITEADEIWEARAAGINQWLDRSRVVPLSFYIIELPCSYHYNEDLPDGRKRSPSDQARSLFNIIYPHAHRWLELHLVMTDLSAQPFFNMDSAQVPCLKNLNLSQPVPTASGSGFPSLAFSQLLKATLLQEVSLFSFPDFDRLEQTIGIQWKRLTTLILDSTSINYDAYNLFHMLRSAQALQHLHLQITNCVGDPESQTATWNGYITLPHLRSLRVYEHFYSPVLRLLSKILHCPLLEDVEYYDSAPSPLDPGEPIVLESGSLGLILSHSGALVRSLTLNPLLYTTQQIIDYLRCCPSLETLLMVKAFNPYIREFMATMINNQLLDSLVTPDPTLNGKVLCPRLSVLAWDRPSVITFGQFLDFLEKKQSGMLDGVCRLRKVVASFSAPEDAEFYNEALKMMPGGRKEMGLLFEALNAGRHSMRDGRWDRHPGADGKWHDFNFAPHLKS